MPKGNSFFRSYWAALLWAAFILLLCGIPGKDLPDVNFWAINIEDKIAHVGIFFVLGFFMIYGQVLQFGGFNLRAKTLVLIIVIGVFYGALTEALQHFVFIDRYASLADFLADGLGAVFGTVFAFFYFKKRKSRQ